MIDFDVVRSPHSWLLLLLGLALYAYRRTRSRGHSESASSSTPIVEEKKIIPEYSEDAYYQIEPLTDFDLDHTEPEKLRPFKPKYYLTMAIQNITPSELVAMDKTYASRVALRKHLLQTRQQDVLAYTSDPRIAPAVREFYDWIMGVYLPRRFPTLFTLTEKGLRNHVTSETITISPTDIEEALRLLGENIDDDFLFLMPDPAPSSCDTSTTATTQAPPSQGPYRLQAFITLFPSGFRTLYKLGLTLSDIHGPVPHYKPVLEKSMDRFFASLPTGKVIKRHNWGVTRTRELLLLGGTHLSGEEGDVRDAREGGLDEGGKADEEQQEEEHIDINETVVRCERQTLHRLPRSRAIVFAFKTYQYGLKELRDEGMGHEIADAIEGLGKGNAPGMTRYKSAVVWGRHVCRFLRGEGEGREGG
ncbi:uncharacterized protein EI97DRAFT_498339 [Westerdykella ornata]|uniref:HRQ family protein 2 n=1 Tax=Westerdykella ornata TaxID=318751 RepID=A0A6A6JU05_WESOR|nr:uncharacterized protein EI97DRAFT_498339 [Westerdykella ornata]KAF2280062.1 hypothetical protein EI97DRAFT_498339 [Westerdykella ornata]